MLRKAAIEIDRMVMWLLIIAVVIVLLLFMTSQLSPQNCESAISKLFDALGIAREACT